MSVTKLGISIPEELLGEIDKGFAGVKRTEVRLLEKRSQKMINDYQETACY